MFRFRRLSRDRSSKAEQDLNLDSNNSNNSNNADSAPPYTNRFSGKTTVNGGSAENSRPATSYAPQDPQSRKRGQAAPASKDSQFDTSNEMLRNPAPHGAYNSEHAHPGAYIGRNQHGNGSGENVAGSPRAGGAREMGNNSYEQPPDPLSRAFNEAIKPYLEQIHVLKAEVEQAQQQVSSLASENAALSSERGALHTWIDKRGLRPDLPTSLAAGFPASTVAASTLSTQLDRKMTMLNYSLHHLADSAPEPLPASTVTSTLTTLLPPVEHLASLPSGGPAFAFEALIKLAGNLNSHSTGEETDADRANVADFYDRLDDAMVDVVGRRIQGDGSGERWNVEKDVNRLEKTGGFLRKEMAVRNYFLRSLEVMKTDAGRHGGHAGQLGGGGQNRGSGVMQGTHNERMMYEDQ